MSGELAVAILAEHVQTGSPIADIVGRLGTCDEASLASESLTILDAAAARRDLVVRRSDSESPPVTDRSGNPPPMRNRFAGTCRCRRTVPEGRGRAVRVDGKWSVYCYSCAKEHGYAS